MIDVLFTIAMLCMIPHSNKSAASVIDTRQAQCHKFYAECVKRVKVPGSEEFQLLDCMTERVP